MACCRSRLEAEVVARFPGQPDWAQMWLRGTHPALGRSPWEQSVGERMLQRCRRLLDAARPKGRLR
ncbi:antitoxin Xre/MbcA/ParS toxin-binding domain-containing protein [Pseudoroseomonas deserti]|uniref:antitoxin Xre/MbcA/ParS toxin-binding domain-containing protein n=1 Tax=Teichococcus deserti TaxID=1817963 RepID=UPI003462F970